MEIVVDTKNYAVIDVAIVDSMTLLNGIREKFEAIVKTEMTGKAKEYYASFLKKAIDNAKKELIKKAEELGGDALYDIKIEPLIKNIKGDMLIGAVAQAIVLKKGEK